MAQGNLYVVSAASGAGKTSLLAAVLQQFDDVELSVSHTTRAPRDGEVNGVNYHFVNHEQFEAMVDAGKFLEHAAVFGNHYGTSGEHIQQQLKCEKDVILEIDWQGARQIRRLIPECISIFIAPPSITALKQRLMSRGQDDMNVIESRMQQAVNEMSHYVEFDYLVINDDFDQAKANLSAIIIANRQRLQYQQQKYQKLLSELLSDTTSNE